jgi:hypothetical protein
MPLTDIQRLVIQVLRPFRGPDNYVGGGAALNLNWNRLSDDMDIFRDSAARLPAAVAPEVEALRAAGFAVNITSNDDWGVEAIVGKYGFETKVQWLNDEDFRRRFFPAEQDDTFGFRLHLADNVVNKVWCAMRRNQAPRDAIDLVQIVRRYCPLGPLVFALPGKVPDLTPPRILADLRCIAFGYSDDELTTVRMEGDEVLARADIRAILSPAFDRAQAYCEDEAPDRFLGQLIVTDADVPVEASSVMIERGEVRTIEIQDFSPLVQFGD